MHHVRKEDRSIIKAGGHVSTSNAASFADACDTVPASALHAPSGVAKCCHKHGELRGERRGKDNRDPFKTDVHGDKGRRRVGGNPPGDSSTRRGSLNGGHDSYNGTTSDNGGADLQYDSDVGASAHISDGLGNSVDLRRYEDDGGSAGSGRGTGWSKRDACNPPRSSSPVEYNWGVSLEESGASGKSQESGTFGGDRRGNMDERGFAVSGSIRPSSSGARGGRSAGGEYGYSQWDSERDEQHKDSSSGAGGGPPAGGGDGNYQRGHESHERGWDSTRNARGGLSAGGGTSDSRWGTVGDGNIRRGSGLDDHERDSTRNARGGPSAGD